MNACIPLHRLFEWALVILALAAPFGCTPAQSGPQAQDGPAIDWESPRMRAIEKKWEALRDDHGRVGGGKDEYREYLRSVDRLFQKRLPARRLRELTASSKLPPVPVEDTFAYVMLTY